MGLTTPITKKSRLASLRFGGAFAQAIKLNSGAGCFWSELVESPMIVCEVPAHSTSQRENGQAFQNYPKAIDILLFGPS